MSNFNELYEELSKLNESEYGRYETNSPYRVVIHRLYNNETKAFKTPQEALDCFVEKASELIRYKNAYNYIEIGFQDSGDCWHPGELFDHLVQIWSYDIIKAGQANGIYRDVAKQTAALNDYPKYVTDKIEKAKTEYIDFVRHYGYDEEKTRKAREKAERVKLFKFVDPSKIGQPLYNVVEKFPDGREEWYEFGYQSFGYVHSDSHKNKYSLIYFTKKEADYFVELYNNYHYRTDWKGILSVVPATYMPSYVIKWPFYTPLGYKFTCCGYVDTGNFWGKDIDKYDEDDYLPYINDDVEK